MHFGAGGLVAGGQLEVPAVVVAARASAQGDAPAGEAQVGRVVVHRGEGERPTAPHPLFCGLVRAALHRLK